MERRRRDVYQETVVMVWVCTSCEGENTNDSLYACEHCGYVYYDSTFYGNQYQDSDDIETNKITRAAIKKLFFDFFCETDFELGQPVSFAIINIIMKSFVMYLLNQIFLKKMAKDQRMISKDLMVPLVRDLRKFHEGGPNLLLKRRRKRLLTP
jgi:hypothetical protein